MRNCAGDCQGNLLSIKRNSLAPGWDLRKGQKFVKAVYEYQKAPVDLLTGAIPRAGSLSGSRQVRRGMASIEAKQAGLEFLLFFT